MEHLEEAARGTDDLVVQLHSARRDLTAAASRELQAQRELEAQRQELEDLRTASRELEAQRRELEEQQVRPY